MNPSSARTSVGSVMKRDVLAVDAGWSLEELARFLLDRRISGAPVVSADGEPVGVVSLTDVARFRAAPEQQAERRDVHEYYLHTLEGQVAAEEAPGFHLDEASGVTVEEIMTPMVFEVAEDATLSEAADIMVKGRIHRLFVTRENRICGVVSALDLLDALRQD
ncbi:MAG TPA: CBS domain-containing protein [Gammaproteobacteria bacterium]|nr:CBS domain-containing protein [Gammaproteobacteria bacterium]